MKSTDSGIKHFTISENSINNFIAGTTSDRKTVAMNELGKLDSENKTVYITDPYLFCGSAHDPDYERDLALILKHLKAAKIVYCASSIQDQQLFQNICNDLAKQNCQLIHDSKLTDCHDRFWYCSDTNKAVVFGTSFNGLCKKICRVDLLKEEETDELNKELKIRGIV